MRLGLLRETAPRESRVALVPDGVAELTGLGFEVAVESGAGSGAELPDEQYADAGATILDAGSAAEADIVVSVHDLFARTSNDGVTYDADADGGRPAPGTIFIGVFDPLWEPRRAEAHAAAGISAFSMDLVPRITRAQTMDVLSSMGTIAGYQSVLLAASRLHQMFPLMMTAAGTLVPAKVLVLGAGVAGLQAIATSRRLGAVVEAYDVREAAVEQIRSMGARAVELDLSATQPAEGAGGYAAAQTEDTAARQRELLAPHVADADVVITTAAIPGRASPLLVTAEMVAAMSAGSVVVDLAAQRGGNCELTDPDNEVVHNGVTVLGPTDLPSRCARHASQMFSRNLTEFLKYLAPDGEVDLRASSAADESAPDGAPPGDADEATGAASSDEIISAMLVSHNGAVVHAGVAGALRAAEADNPANTGRV